ncbi:TrkH family potassium uptake protein [Poseidonocella sp. HB161398]|uniref:TrkH family potassium uptake protein n=1 Tax=Poseidonocella sp. HB161398 TaxID=2320855 RepID=UPI001109867E|nr:potassium transporter TrkG [Poseidonocella sp. HB161398]
MALTRHSVPALSRGIMHSPPASLALLYLSCILIGAGLLKLPLCHDGTLNWADAVFTSVSAVTVTGLAVVDTGSVFTFAGQAVILVLIQLGGLGLMAFAVLLLFLLGVPIGIPHKLLLREELNQSGYGELRTIVWLVFWVAVISELAGTMVLSTVFVPEFGPAEGLWMALFHSVSAFNNAGFALFPDSLSRYVTDPVVNLAIPALILVGGLGFIVLGDLAEERRWQRLTLHSKLMITGTVALLGLSWVLFAALEWRNPGTLGALGGPWAKIGAAWFQAVSPRTAGFNTVDTSQLHDSTVLLTMALMLIGGGSTSTAGGIKVTTLCVLLIATVAFFRRETVMRAFGRSFGPEDVFKVMALATVSTITIMLGMFLISISHDGEFTDLAFEVVSAFGTVGLSRGATGELDGLGRTVIMLLMFLGRVGPLTLGFFLATRAQPRVRYPKGRVYLG